MAADSSLSPNETETNKNESVKDKEETTERRLYHPPKTVTLADYSSDFIVRFAQACYDNPECQALVLRNCFAKEKIEELVVNHQKNFYEDEIIDDAVKLFSIAKELVENYSKVHDDANKQIAEIMERHIPEFQKELNQIHTDHLKRNKK